MPNGQSSADGIAHAVAIVTDTLQQLADKDHDLTDHVYQLFFAHCSEAKELMGHSDQSMRGRMLDQTFALVMDPKLHAKDGYFAWEINNHVCAYGVTSTMYPEFLSAIKQSVKATLSPQWTMAAERAWDMRIEALLASLADTQ